MVWIQDIFYSSYVFMMIVEMNKNDCVENDCKLSCVSHYSQSGLQYIEV